MFCGKKQFHYGHLSRLLAYASRRGQDARRARVAILHPKNRNGVGGDVRTCKKHDVQSESKQLWFSTHACKQVSGIKLAQSMRMLAVKALTKTPSTTFICSSWPMKMPMQVCHFCSGKLTWMVIKAAN